MNLTLSKVFLNKNVDLYFSKSNYVYVSGPLGLISNKLNFFFDFKTSTNNRSFKASSIRNIFSFFKFGISSVTLGYYIFIDLIGLGYKIKKITSNIFRLYVGQSHYIYIFVPVDVLFWSYQNKITMFSIYADKLFSVSTNIMLLRKLNAYKLRGLMRPGQIVILKEGKQR